MIGDLIQGLKEKYVRFTLDDPNVILLLSSRDFSRFGYRMTYLENLDVYCDMKHNGHSFIPYRGVKYTAPKNIFAIPYEASLTHYDIGADGADDPIGIILMSDTDQIFFREDFKEKKRHSELEKLCERLKDEKKHLLEQKENFRELLFSQRIKAKEAAIKK